VDRARLAATAFFAGLPDEELDVIARAATECEYSEGQRLTNEGDFGHALILLESGSADVWVNGARVWEVRSGEVIGEVAVLSSGRRTASVVATSPVRAAAWLKRDVWALERTAPEAARRLRAALDEHVGAPGADG
jgi:CRP-like cAMP-binding protein